MAFNIMWAETFRVMLRFEFCRGSIEVIVSFGGISWRIARLLAVAVPSTLLMATYVRHSRYLTYAENGHMSMQTANITIRRVATGGVAVKGNLKGR